MKTITLSAEAFDKVFKQTLEKLELQNLRSEWHRLRPEATPAEVDRMLVDIHRTFVYEVCNLKSELEKL